MRHLPKLSCALLALFGFGACGGENGQDLFTPGTFGIGTGARGGVGNAARGGTSSGGGVTFVTGGSSTGGVVGQGGVVGRGGVIGQGGSLLRGGATSTGGSTLSGGSLSSGGRTAGGASNASGGRIGSGGRVGTGGTSSSANCSSMRTELSALLERAQICTSAGTVPPCTGSVTNECGCLVPVNNETAAATVAYRNQLEMIGASCAKYCADPACVNPTGAWCMTQGSDASGHCLGTNE